jgi:hypothetical protein
MYLSQVTDKLYHIYISTLNGRNSTNLSKFINNHIFEICNVCVNTPTMLKGKSQLEPEEIIRDRRVASNRIHIERVTELSKAFTILRTDLSNTMLQLANRFVNVCFRLTNFKNVIVDKFA